MPLAPKYRRVLLKVSGEALMGEGIEKVEADFADEVAQMSGTKKKPGEGPELVDA